MRKPGILAAVAETLHGHRAVRGFSIADNHGKFSSGGIRLLHLALHARLAAVNNRAHVEVAERLSHGDRKEFEAIARVRLAGLLMDEKSYDKAVSLLTGFTPATDTERLVIDDRLGDVYQAMGKNAEARKAWQDGISAARDGDPLQNLIRLKLDSLPEDGTAAPAPAAASAAASSAAASAPASPPAAKSSAAG